MLEIKMALAKATKNTNRFEAVTEEGKAIAPTLYVQKSAFKGQLAPQFITVTIDEAE